MNIKSLILKFLTTFSILSGFILILSVIAISKNTQKNQNQIEKLYLKSTYEIYKNELIGLVIIQDFSALNTLIQEIEKKREVIISIKTAGYSVNSDYLSNSNQLIIPIINGTENIGKVYLKIKNSFSFWDSNFEIVWLFLLQLLIFGIGYYILSRQIQTRLAQPILTLTKAKDNGFIESFNVSNNAVHEIKNLAASLKNLYFEVNKKAKEHITAEITKQVAHDIRSPLSALNIITSTLTDIPEEKRLLIRNSVQRINDIANELLQKGISFSFVENDLSNKSEKSKDNNKNFNKYNLTTSSLSSNLLKTKNNILASTVIDNIVSEKRIQFREKINVHINVDLKYSFGLFVNANPNELSRVISNLINNSVEALPNQSGNIEVSVFTNSDSKVCIQIKDNGSGIPKNILEKLGQAGITHGKENSQSGSGLGVYHAIKTIQEFGGQIKFHSITANDLINKNNEFDVNQESVHCNLKESTGTTITIELPKTDTPDWFAESIQLNPWQEFVTVDDDISIHQIWKGRLQSLKYSDHQIKLNSFTSAKEFREFFNNTIKYKIGSESQKLNSKSDSSSHFIFLIDFEFLNQNDNGFKIITDLGIQDKAILVTSRFDEPQIRNECEAQKIKILPKQLAGQIPIKIHSALKNTENILKTKLSKYDLCLIDDDKLLVHSIWGMVAKEKGLNIRMFERPEEFLSETDKIDKSTPIYVDVSLANNVNGIDIANVIHEQGFENINLATGYDSEFIKAPRFIRQIVGKDFPDLT